MDYCKLSNSIKKIFDNYYQKYHRAIDIYSPEVEGLEEYDIVDLVKVVNSDKKFFRIDNTTFGLLYWLLDEIEEYLSLREVIDFNTIYEIARKIYNADDMDEYNLKKLFPLNSNEYDIEYINRLRNVMQAYYINNL